MQTLSSGRIIYRHPSNQGSVIEFDMFGRKTKLFVADAKYRTTATWGDYPRDHGMTKYKSGYYINPRNTFDPQIAQPLSYTVSDAELQQRFPNLAACRTETALHNTDRLMKFPNVEAARACRAVSIDSIGPLSLPNIYELVVIYVEADTIDVLDPTVRYGHPHALGFKNTTNRFHAGGTDFYWSSCETSSLYATHVDSYGSVDYYHKICLCGVCPVAEL